MRWFVGILAVVAVLFSAGSLYFAYMAGVPAAHEGLSGPDAPGMQWTVGGANVRVGG